MKLYYAPGACSLAPHIVAREAQLPLELVRVDTRTHRLENGDDFYGINPRGYVPVLELADGSRLREGAVIVQFLADTARQGRVAVRGGCVIEPFAEQAAAASDLIPPAGTMERVRAQEWLNFIATEMHKQFIPLLRGAPPEVLQAQREKVRKALAEVDGHLEWRRFVLGEAFSVVDAYLFAITRWCSLERVGVSLESFDHLAGYMRRVADRPAVRAALSAEIDV